MPDLTAREIEIIRLMAAGHSNKAIAEGLNLTEPSVKVQIRRLLRKIGAANRTQAAIWAMERGLVRVE
jgi:two-component system nitrate/nitrite response regulator NarL